ncbi:hypothetical protein [Cupriavidus sp. USMAHM13]|uniref:hypothetical protein n=1 Tax=Cupriavidus sp. USMAHM13 TaxID=1389192 RepID=UPI0009F67766|nr:hypothetical protein [Cupriavidus sp. USMAHM13]
MQNTNNKLILGAIAAAVLSLSACGGGGDGGSSSPAAAATPTPTPAPTPTITVSGSATPVSGDPLAVIFVPQDETSTKSTGHSIASNAFPAALQLAPSNGGYTQLGVDANSLVKLNGGTVADVAGNGSFAIGRWTNGSDSIGNVSANQGAHYAVGKPLTLIQDLTLQPDLTLGPKRTCTAVANTLPTAVSGNYAPGRLNSATATIAMSGPTLQTVSLDISIGSDAHATATISGTILNGVFSSNGVLHHVEVLGTSQTNFYLAFGYAMPTPSSGDVTGVVVMQCQ